MWVFALKIVFGLSVWTSKHDFEKYILRDQIYILSAKLNKKRVFSQKQNEEKCGFCIENRFLALHA